MLEKLNKTWCDDINDENVKEIIDIIIEWRPKIEMLIKEENAAAFDRVFEFLNKVIADFNTIKSSDVCYLGLLLIIVCLG